jgi:ArsR family transcriptional regulator
MTEQERRRSEARAKILKALAHPSRIYIVEKLYQRPHCVRELTQLIGADTSTVSKHLSVLKNAGLLQDEKRRQTVLYSLTAPCIINFIGCIENVIKESFEREYSYIYEESEEL